MNIPSGCRTVTLKGLSEDTLAPTLFDAARHECYQLMARDTMPRFMATPAFGQLLTYFGSYDVSDNDAGCKIDVSQLDLDPMAA